MAKRGLGRGIDAIIPDSLSEAAESGRQTPAEERPMASWGPAEIGGLLRSRRENRRLSLDDVQAATKIRKRYLEALEAGEDASSPGEVYFRGFLKIYGDFLGLDGQALVRQYKAAKNPPPPPQATAGAAPGVGEPAPALDARPVEATPATRETPQEAAQVAPAAPEEGAPDAVTVTPAPGSARRRRRSTSGAWRLPFVLFLAAILAVAIGVRIVEAMSPPAAGPPAAGTPAAGTPAAPVEEQPQPAPNPPPKPEQQAPLQAPPARPEPEVAREDRSEYLTVIGIKAESLELEASVKDGQCWVRVEADGKVIAEELLDPGARRVWEASDRLVIRVGAPWTMRLTLNGVDLGMAGPQGGAARDFDISRTE